MVDLVLDPFGGSGTVALEAILAGRRAIFAEVNPLAQLIAQVKTAVISSEQIEEARQRVFDSRSLTMKKAVSPPQVVTHHTMDAGSRHLPSAH